MSLLTNPTDGKADNYMVEFEYEESSAGEKAVKALHLVGIDSDMPLVMLCTTHNTWTRVIFPLKCATWCISCLPWMNPLTRPVATVS